MWRAHIQLDTLDDANFPRKGYAFVAEASILEYESGGDPIRTYLLNGLLPVTFGRLTLLGIANARRSRDDRGGFGLGGFLNLSGTPPGAVSGSQAGYLAALAYWHMGRTRGALGGDWYAGFSLEAGNAWKRASDFARDDVRKAGSLFLGLDSLIGPLYFAYGRTFGGESAWYLFLGRPGYRGL